MATVDRVAFTLWGNPIYWYGILIAIGAFLALFSAARREARVGLPKDTTLNVSLIMIPVALLCARIYYVAFAWDYFAGDFWRMIDVRQGGMAIYGGVIGGILVAFFYARAKKLSFLRIADLIVPSLALGQAIGRWGNFFNQEAYGIPIANPACQFFPLAVWIEAEQGWFAATFFYESLWCFLLFAALLLLERMGKKKRNGDLFLWYGLLYCYERTIVEGLRLDSLYAGTARVSQMLSLFVMVACAGIVLYRSIGQWRRAKPAFFLIILSIAASLLTVPSLLTGTASMLIALPVSCLAISAIWLYAYLPHETDLAK